MAGPGHNTVGGKLIERFPELLLNEMCELTEQNTSSLEDVIITDQDTQEEGWEKELRDPYDIAGLLSEAGAPICEKDGKYFLGEVQEPETGAGCRIDRAYCASKRAKTVGSFHTHPLGGTTPSLPDLQTSANEKEEVFCIGGRIGDKRKVTCYAPGPRVKSWGGPVYNPLAGYYPTFDVPETGKIVFYREPPPPLASELNAEMTDETIAERITDYGEDYTEKELKKKIKEVRAGFERGEIFEEFWENYQAEGEMDELETYSPKDLERLEKLKLAFLSRDYYIRSAECPTEHYELEKVTFGPSGMDGIVDEPLEEEIIAKSNSIEELEEIAKTVKLKGGRYRNQELRILRIDKHGDIHYEKFLER